MLYHRVLVTGANGLVGQTLVALLGSRPEYDVLATGRDPLPRSPTGSFGYTALDITNAAEVRDLLHYFTPDAVVNCAALSLPDACEADRTTCWRLNVKGTEHLAKACRMVGSRLIQLSTDFVFDGTAGPYAEDERPNPVNFYGQSKWAAENVAREAGLDRWAVVRTVLVYGTGAHLSRSNFVLRLLEHLQQGKPYRVAHDQWRTPTYLGDLVEGIERLIRFEKSGLYHLSGREFLSTLDLARTVARTFDLDASLLIPVETAQLHHTAVRPMRTGLLILRAESELGFKPRTLRTGLQHLGLRLGLATTTN
jgi:dTDP-4-dehydrorhamnose reductase